jgi:hypothetical protein
MTTSKVLNDRERHTMLLLPTSIGAMPPSSLGTHQTRGEKRDFGCCLPPHRPTFISPPLPARIIIIIVVFWCSRCAIFPLHPHRSTLSLLNSCCCCWWSPLRHRQSPLFWLQKSAGKDAAIPDMLCVSVSFKRVCSDREKCDDDPSSDIILTDCKTVRISTIWWTNIYESGVNCSIDTNKTCVYTIMNTSYSIFLLIIVQSHRWY